MEMSAVSDQRSAKRLTCGAVIGAFFEYDTPKIVHITNKKVGVINRLCQLVIIGYIVGYVIVYQKGYQEFDDVVSGTTTKVKGIAQTNYTALNMTGPGGLKFRIWDVADYVIPPQENGAFFVMTNVIYTPRQTQTTCDEDPLYITCQNDSDCKVGEQVPNGNGIQTGECIPSTRNGSIKVCAIHAWCPVETDELPIKNDTLLAGTEDFTVLIKNNIEFPKFKAKSRNILDNQNQSYLQACQYNRSHSADCFCPVFRLGTIVDLTETKYRDIAVMGGVIGINIDWNCNLDHSIKNCAPVYSFTRLDEANAKIAKGTNFRYANYYDNNNTAFRDLYKAYGIRFIVRVTGKAGKFSIIPLLLNIGSGVGLLAIATVVCDVITLYLLKKGNYYKENKYLYVDEFPKDELSGGTAANGNDDEPLLDDRA